MAKVLISDKMSEGAVEVFRARGIEVDIALDLEPEELIGRIGAYDGLALRSATQANAEVIAAGKKLKVVGRAGIGVDNIDVEAATRRGIVVMNTPSGNAVTTAEHSIAMLFALARQIPAADRSTRAGKWEKSRFMGVELTGKTLGVIGCGNIGAIVAERARALRMRVVAYDPYVSPERARDLGVEKVAFDELLARADFITLHVPMTEETRGMIDAAALAKAKRGVRIVNCARGGLVVEADLKAAIESGQVAGAALDVFADEPARDNPLFAMDEIVATPHLGAATTEAQEKVAVQVAEQMSDYLLTGAMARLFNVPQEAGFLVQRVATDSPAHRLGLQPGYLPVELAGEEFMLGGDIILKMVGIAVGPGERLAQIQQRLSQLRPGDRLSVEVLRGGEIINLAMTY